MICFVIGSFRKTIPAIVEKSGVVEDIGTATDPLMWRKLNANRNQARPNDTRPDTAKISHIFFGAFKSLNCLSANGDVASRRIEAAKTLIRLMAKASSSVLVSTLVTASFINVIPAAHITAAESDAINPLVIVFVCELVTALFSCRLISQIPEIMLTAPIIMNGVISSPFNVTAIKILNKGYVLAIGTALETPRCFRLNMYKVSARTKLMIPLKPAAKATDRGKSTKFPVFPNTAPITNNNAPAEIDRIALA